MDESGFINSFTEKPKQDALGPWVSDTGHTMQAQGRNYLASMGIYIFNRQLLTDLLQNEYVEASEKQPVLILRDGEPVAMLVGLDRKEKQTPMKLREVLRRAWKDYEDHGGIPHKQFWKDLAKEADKSQPV